MKNGFKLESLNKSFIVLADTQDLKESWIHDLQQCIEMVTEKGKKKNSKNSYGS